MRSFLDLVIGTAELHILALYREWVKSDDWLLLVLLKANAAFKSYIKINFLNIWSNFYFYKNVKLVQVKNVSPFLSPSQSPNCWMKRHQFFSRKVSKHGLFFSNGLSRSRVAPIKSLTFHALCELGECVCVWGCMRACVCERACVWESERDRSVTVEAKPPFVRLCCK